ncbi:hypothetical protein FT663_02456 [Candidozyma haemuli var. vulneris]|uniref:L-serine ammonia-lyase n=1 Tax=Candidozyma haemuli TaxID=45357 RepID=A0A2V1AS33_9ASCO|nr:hypothetical protein CXQ85_002390 [[Candida] haemuloni]KAF3989886.1 hypothetical protein FT662_02564 [[Candida] haemuloni var. vulneris]KAF3992012.1 hypothetical protein FT663_02456 [[Candida] haemuloni var. vulneris]PVH20595.1 hypothetical protein CXQ85_002390 [[Candida] haemuloni]
MLQVHDNTSAAPAVQTSLVEVTDLLSTSGKLPCRVFFKNEIEQPSGSFKLRGIGHLIHQSIRKAKKADSQKPIHVFASSGGNAGLAAAYSAKFYNVKCTVVVPTIAMKQVVEKLRSYGATVLLHGNSISDADKFARSLMAEAENDFSCIYCHPFDNPLIWKGHSLLVDEMFQNQLSREDAKKVRGVVCSVGGGGLFNGIKQGLMRNGSKADCVLVETAQAPTLSSAVKAGSVVTLNCVRSLATSLACSYVSGPTLDLFNDQSTNKNHITAIDDLEAVKGCIAYQRDFGKMVEPACGAAVSVVYNQLKYLKESVGNLTKDDIVIVVVCGGSCANEAVLDRYKSMLRSEAHL